MEHRLNGGVFLWPSAAVTGYVFSEEELVIVVPDSLGGYRVTRLTGPVRGKTIRELVIPEGVTFLGERVFCDNEIRVLAYNAADAGKQ